MSDATPLLTPWRLMLGISTTHCDAQNPEWQVKVATFNGLPYTYLI